MSDELRRLAKEATPGRWHEVGRDIDHDKFVAAGRNPADACGLGCDIEGPPEASHRGQFERHADAAYIAAASPDVILGLLDRIAELERAAELGAAMAEAEAALPSDGFFMLSRSVPGRYMAHWRNPSDDQYDTTGEYVTGNPRETYGHGLTPAAALRELTKQHRAARSSSKVETT